MRRPGRLVARLLGGRRALGGRFLLGGLLRSGLFGGRLLGGGLFGGGPSRRFRRRLRSGRGGRLAGGLGRGRLPCGLLGGLACRLFLGLLLRQPLVVLLPLLLQTGDSRQRGLVVVLLLGQLTFQGRELVPTRGQRVGGLLLRGCRRPSLAWSALACAAFAASSAARAAESRLALWLRVLSRLAIALSWLPETWSSSSRRCSSSVALPAVQQRCHRSEDRTLPERRGSERGGLGLGVVDRLACGVGVGLRLLGGGRRGGGVRLRHLEIDGGLVGQFGLQLHVVLQALDVAFGLADQPGQPADLGRGCGGLALAGLDLVIGRVLRRGWHSTGGDRHADDHDPGQYDAAQHRDDAAGTGADRHYRLLPRERSRG